MVLIDTNVIIALVDSSDALHAQAIRDLGRLAKAQLVATSAVLCESIFGLPRADQRARLSLLLERLPILPGTTQDEGSLRRDVFAWLTRYAEHNPDYADAELCVLAGRDRRVRIWSYDSEFKDIWRKPDGRHLPLVGK